MDEKITALLDALCPLLTAVEVNDGDTLASLSVDETVIWEATGSWSSAASLTLGDLRRIYNAAKAVGA